MQEWKDQDDEVLTYKNIEDLVIRAQEDHL